MRKFLLFVGAILSMVIWMIVTLCVAMPGKWFAFDILDISGTFLTGKHFIFVALLILVDVFIAIILLDDISLKQRMLSKMGLFGITVSMVATLAVSSAQGPDSNMLTQNSVAVFTILLGLFGFVRFLTYLTSHAATGTKNGDVYYLNGNQGVANRTLTAIPVGSLKN